MAVAERQGGWASGSLRQWVLGAVACALLLLLPYGSAMLAQPWPNLGALCNWRESGRSSSGEQNYLMENEAAMARMMSAMQQAPTGDVDRDFVAMMVPHHQGAIDMAVAELHHGRNEQLRRIAQEIVVTQQQEIRAMQLVIGNREVGPDLDQQSSPAPIRSNPNQPERP